MEALTLSSDTYISGGNGSKDNPYVIEDVLFIAGEPSSQYIPKKNA